MKPHGRLIQAEHARLVRVAGAGADAPLIRAGEPQLPTPAGASSTSARSSSRAGVTARRRAPELRSREGGKGLADPPLVSLAPDVGLKARAAPALGTALRGRASPRVPDRDSWGRLCHRRPPTRAVRAPRRRDPILAALARTATDFQARNSFSETLPRSLRAITFRYSFDHSPRSRAKRSCEWSCAQVIVQSGRRSRAVVRVEEAHLIDRLGLSSLNMSPLRDPRAYHGRWQDGQWTSASVLRSTWRTSARSEDGERRHLNLVGTGKRPSP